MQVDGKTGRRPSLAGQRGTDRCAGILLRRPGRRTGSPVQTL